MIFPNLQVFRFNYVPDYPSNPDPKIFIKFLKNNGKTLINLCISGFTDKLLNLSIIQCCPNLKNLVIIIQKDELDTLKNTFNGCQYLESIKICGHFINEKEILRVIAKYSPKNFHKLRICNYEESKLLPEELESFFISWGKRIPQKLLTFITIHSLNEENMIIIEKYMKLGIVKEFKTEGYDVNEYLFS